MPAVLSIDEQGNTRYGFDDSDAVKWWRTGRLAEHPYLMPAEGAGLRIDEMPAMSNLDVKAQLEDCSRRVEGQGHEVLVLDQTRPTSGSRSRRSSCPVCGIFWARFAPGRLYDVPVRLGWLPGPLAEDRLNPVAMFL